MNPPGSTQDRLIARAQLAGLSLSPELAERLAGYYDLLRHWNRTMNLTSLEDSEDALDRLILEPVAAAQFLEAGKRLTDVGSGGGSPAIPLAMALAPSELVMIEVKERKAAFLREALRHTGIHGRVEQGRFEDSDPALRGTSDIVSVRAVKIGSAELMPLSSFLAPGGTLALFRRAQSPVIAVPASLKVVAVHSLLASSRAELHLLKATG